MPSSGRLQLSSIYVTYFPPENIDVRPWASIKVHCGRLVSIMTRLVRQDVEGVSDHTAIGVAPKLPETPYLTSSTPHPKTVF